MTSKTTKWYHTLKGYAIWVILGLFYFAMGSQLNVQRGLFHAFFFVPMQYVIYTLSMKHLLPRFYDSKKNKIKYYNAILILSFTLFGVSVEVLYRKLFPGAFLHEFHFLSSFVLYTILCLTALWAGTTKFLIGIQEKVSVEIETLKREKAESDLRFLKTQINPHFLFNALNNIYSMAYTGDESAPEKITMLSDMLRYVLYDCESDSISLYKEVDYIHSYLEFQQLKTEKRQNISLKLGTYDENYQIAPMLLVTFIENGFKHSQIEKNKEGFVNIYLTQDSERFLFTVDNSIPEHSVQNPNGKSRGIGIENARNRLNLLYPNKHKLEIVNKGNRHKISLELYK